MKKLIIILLAIITLTGCKTPNYSTGKDLSGVIEASIGSEVATYNGYVIEVTEDNMIRIKVPKRGDKIQEGWAVHEDGIIKVALASASSVSPKNNNLKEIQGYIHKGSRYLYSRNSYKKWFSYHR